MEKVICNYDILEEIYTTFDKMDYKAYEYTPSVTDLKIMSEDLPKYMPFLLWIEETGVETEENMQIRSAIKRLIKSSLEIID